MKTYPTLEEVEELKEKLAFIEVALDSEIINRDNANRKVADLEEILSNIKMIVNHTEELNMANYDESLVSDMNNAFIAISEALTKIKETK